MKKVLKKICFIAVLLSLFACEETPSEYEYIVYNPCENVSSFGREVIIDNVNCFEMDKNNIIVNKREIGEMRYQDKKTFRVSSAISFVKVIYRYREMNNSGSPHTMKYFKTDTYSLNTEITEIKLQLPIEITEEEFYNLINNY